MFAYPVCVCTWPLDAKLNLDDIMFKDDSLCFSGVIKSSVFFFPFGFLKKLKPNSVHTYDPVQYLGFQWILQQSSELGEALVCVPTQQNQVLFINVKRVQANIGSRWWFRCSVGMTNA